MNLPIPRTLRKLVGRNGMLAIVSIALSSCATEDMEIFSQAFAQEFSPTLQQELANNAATTQQLADGTYSSGVSYDNTASEDSTAQFVSTAASEEPAPTPSSENGPVVTSPAAAPQTASSQPASPRVSTARTPAPSSQSPSGGPAMFVGVYRESTGQKYVHWENSRVAREPLGNPSEFKAAETRFKSQYRDSRSTYLLDQRRSAIVYNYVSYAMGASKDRRLIEHSVVYGKTLAEARTTLDQRVAERPAEYLSQPTVVFTWGN